MSVHAIRAITVLGRLTSNQEFIAKVRKLTVERATQGYKFLELKHAPVNIDRDYVVSVLHENDGFPVVAFEPLSYLPNHREFDTLWVRW